MNDEEPEGQEQGSQSQEPGEGGRPKPRVDRATFRSYLAWIGRYWTSASVLVGLALVSAILDSAHPLFLRYVLDSVLLVDSFEPGEKLARINLVGGIFLLVIVVGQMVNVTKDYQTRLLNHRLVLSLRRALFGRMVRLPLHTLSDMKTGGIISRLTGDVDLTSRLLQLGLISPGVSVLRLVLAIGMLFYLNWRLALLSLLIIPPAMAMSFIVARRIRPVYRAIRRQATAVDGRVGETFGGIRIVRAFRRELLEEVTHAVGRHTIVRENLFAAKREIALWSVWGFLLASVNLAAVWFGGTLHVKYGVSIGDIVAFQWYALLVLNPVWQIVNSFSELQRSLAAMERVFGILAMEEDKPDRDDALVAPGHVDEIRFENVSFEYESGRPVLHDLSFSMSGGTTVALVGRSGAGKSTVADLLARFLDPTSGRISLNGTDIRELSRDSYRNLIGIVQQETFLFDGSLRDNLAYGRRDASDEEVIVASQRANAHEFIVELEQGYASQIGERGVKLSGGQAQRISIARALLASPQILILDEATSNLDTESEQLIQQSLHELIEGRTTLVIAHRLSTVAEADQILVMDEGRIVERGTHHELLAQDGVYSDMVTRQQAFLAGT